MEKHTNDSDCTLDATNTCIGCGVYHGDPCAGCNQRGYHLALCPLSDGAVADSRPRSLCEAVLTEPPLGSFF